MLYYQEELMNLTWLIYSCHFAQVHYSLENVVQNFEWTPPFFSLVHKDFWVVSKFWIGWNRWRNFVWRNRFLAGKIGPGGLTATRGRSNCQSLFQGGLASIATSSNGQNFDLKVVVTSLVVWPQVVLQSDREVPESFQRLVFGVWAINTHPSHAG
jgi:hypothetical protein